MNAAMEQRDWRDISGSVAAYGSVGAFVIALIAFILLELSFNTWAVGRYLAGHADVLVGVFLLVWAFCSLTFVLSLCGRGRLRGIGAIVSVVTIIFMAVVFRCG